MLHCEARPERRAVLPRPAQQSETHQPSPRPNPAQPPSPAQPSRASPSQPSPASPAQPPAQPSCPVPANKTPSNSLSPANLTIRQPNSKHGSSQQNSLSPANLTNLTTRKNGWPVAKRQFFHRPTEPFRQKEAEGRPGARSFRTPNPK